MEISGSPTEKSILQWGVNVRASLLFFLVVCEVFSLVSFSNLLWVLFLLCYFCP